MKRLSLFFSSSEGRDHHRQSDDHPFPPPPPIPNDIPPIPNVPTRSKSANDTHHRTPTVSVVQSSPNTRYSSKARAVSHGALTGPFLTPNASTPSLPFLQRPLPPQSPMNPYSRPGTASGLPENGTHPGASAITINPVLPGSALNSGATGTGSTRSSRPPTPNILEMPKLPKKKKGRFGKRKKEEGQPAVWRLAAGGSATNLEPYDAEPLTQGESAKDLWNPDGDTLVYLTSKENKDPKFSMPMFRIHSCPLMFNTLGPYIEDAYNVPAPRLGELEFAPNDLFLEVPQTATSSTRITDDEPPTTSHPTLEVTELPKDLTDDSNPENSGSLIMYKVYFPIQEDEMQTLRPATPGRRKKSKSQSSAAQEDILQGFVDVRNLFAFLAQEFLVATASRDQPFDIFSRILVQLRLNLSESAAGDFNATSKLMLAERHLQTYIDELKLDDIRNDDDAIVEALVLGERWRCMRLYHEGFLHACGRWESIRDHPGLTLLSSTTKSRLDRASIDLNQVRLSNLRSRISNFDFPSVWIGEGRRPEYKGWKLGYDRMRSMVIHHVKFIFGSWPPKAGKRGKGGGYSETGGLNRLVVQRLYSDLCIIYDLIVDRDWLHGERIHFEGTRSTAQEDEAETQSEVYRKAMNKIMEEFDISYVPVQPTIPFSLPRLPYRDTSTLKKPKGIFSKSAKKVRADEMNTVLNTAYNRDTLEKYAMNQPVKSFTDMEREFGTGKTIEDVIAFRRGTWIFLYCVLQSLVMTVTDGQGLLNGTGVEYFLCENVKGSPPWEKGANKRQTRLTGLWNENGLLGPGGVPLNNLVAHIDDDIEMTFRRSHCWEVAENWRLVTANTEDDREADDSFGQMQSSFSEYQPGLEVPQSPKLNSHSLEEELPAHNEQDSISEPQQSRLDGAYFSRDRSQQQPYRLQIHTSPPDRHSFQPRQMQGRPSVSSLVQFDQHGRSMSTPHIPQRMRSVEETPSNGDGGIHSNDDENGDLNATVHLQPVKMMPPLDLQFTSETYNEHMGPATQQLPPGMHSRNVSVPIVGYSQQRQVLGDSQSTM